MTSALFVQFFCDSIKEGMGIEVYHPIKNVEPPSIFSTAWNAIQFIVPGIMSYREPLKTGRSSPGSERRSWEAGNTTVSLKSSAGRFGEM